MDLLDEVVSRLYSIGRGMATAGGARLPTERTYRVRFSRGELSALGVCVKCVKIRVIRAIVAVIRAIVASV